MSNHKTALVTGSTSGIGLAIAKTLASSGYNIMFNGFGEADQINAMVQSIATEYNIKTDYSDANIGIPDAVQTMVKQAKQTFGKVDVLVNNAGIQHVAPITDFPDNKWQDIISVNLSAAFHTIKAVLPDMQEHGFGRIINIASVHGLVASVNKSAYVAAKHGLIGLTKVVALENAEANITCNAICPGWVKTPLVMKQIEDRAAREKITIEQATKDLLSEKQPSLKFVSVEEIAELVKFLASEHGRSITGSAMTIDGAWSAR